MKYSKDTLLWLAGVVTALSVMAVSAHYFLGKPLFVEVMLWQVFILLCIVIISAPTARIASSLLRLYCFWLMLVAVFALSWRADIDSFPIYAIIW